MTTGSTATDAIVSEPPISESRPKAIAERAERDEQGQQPQRRAEGDDQGQRHDDERDAEQQEDLAAELVGEALDDDRHAADLVARVAELEGLVARSPRGSGRSPRAASRRRGRAAAGPRRAPRRGPGRGSRTSTSGVPGRPRVEDDRADELGVVERGRAELPDPDRDVLELGDHVVDHLLLGGLGGLLLHRSKPCRLASRAAACAASCGAAWVA